jgi:hypothetical protein
MGILDAMMGGTRELTDDEVFGTAAPVAAVAPKMRELSDDEVFGAASPAAPAPGDLVDALHRGVLRTKGAGQQFVADAVSDAAANEKLGFGEILDRNAVPSPLPAWMDPVTLAESASDYLTSRPIVQSMFGAGDQSLDERKILSQQAVGQTQNEINKIPQVQALQNVNDPSVEGVASTLGALFKDGTMSGLEGIAALGAESLPPMAAAATAGAVTRSPAVMGGMMGLTSGAQERYSEPVSFFASKGLDISTREGVEAALADPALMEEAKARGLTRGTIIGAFDALSMGMAGAQLAKTPLRNMAVQTFAAQPGMGAGGEAAAQLAVDGKINTKEVVLEALGELAMAPVEVMSMRGVLREKMAGKADDDGNVSMADVAEEAAAGDTDAIAILRQSGVTDEQIAAMSPEFTELAADRVTIRQAEDGAREPATDNAGGAMSNKAFNREQARLQAERDGIESGDIDPAAASAAGRTPQARPDVIPVSPDGTARVGGVEDTAMDIVANRNRNMPAVTEPQPTRMSADEIARAQAEMRGGNPNQAEPPPRMVAPEGRLPRTPEQVEGDRQAGQAFDLAERQKSRLSDDQNTSDTQTAGRPEGQDPKPVFLDEDFPVEIVKREFVPMANGRTVEVATVRRYDPRTGQPEDGATEYQVPMRELKQKNYNIDPRRSQDFVSRADRSKVDPNEQTFRATPEDPEVPGAAGPASNIDDRGPVTRADRPEQPEGPGPFADTSQAEAEFAARERARQERASRNDRWEKDDGERARESAEQAYKGAKFSTQPGPQTQDGSWDTDDHGFVKSDKGGPLKFATQVQAAKWILKEGQAKSKTGQFFEMENHPSGNGFTVRERGRNTGPETPPNDGQGNQSESKADGASQPKNRPEGNQPKQLSGPAETRQESAPRQESKPETRPAKDNSPLYEKVPRKPLGIAAWIKAKGGIRDDGGDVRSILGNARAYPGVLNKNGTDADTLALDAWQDGYLPQFTERPEAKDLFKLLEDEMSGVDIHTGEAGDMSRDRNDAIRRNAEIDRLANEYGIDTKGMARGDFEDALADKMSLQEMDEYVQQQDEARAAEFAEAEADHKAFMESKGDAWTPENLYNEGIPRTLADLEKDNADYRSSKAGNIRQAGDGGRKPAADDPGQVQEGGRTGGQREARPDGAKTEEFLDKEIGEVIGADERAKPRDNERDQLELKARQAGKKTNGKEQQAPGGMFDDGTLFSLEDPTHESLKTAKSAPQDLSGVFRHISGDSKESTDLVKAFLIDLSKILNVPLDAMGMGGNLSVRVGSVPGNKVDSGAGFWVDGVRAVNIGISQSSKSMSAVAHEWMHSLDNHLAQWTKPDDQTMIWLKSGLKNDKPKMLSSKQPYKMRRGLASKWKSLNAAVQYADEFDAKMDAMDARLSEKKGKRVRYYSSPEEKLAYAFESYVAQKISETPNPRRSPDGVEAEQIYAAFDDFFAELKTKPAEDGGLGSTFYSNPIGDPRVWKAAADVLGDISGYPGRKRAEWAENWANTLENLSGRGEGPKAPMYMVENMLRTLVQSNDGFLRALSDRVGSPTINKIADHFYAKAGKGKGVGRTFSEAVTMYSQAHFTKIHKILEPFGNDKAALAQVVRQVQNPRSIRKGTQGWRRRAGDPVHAEGRPGVHARGRRRCG